MPLIVMDEKIVQNVRYLCAQVVQRANSGHPGTPLALTPFMHVLYGKILRIHSKKLDHPNRDIFIMSNGHACVIQYVMLVLHGILKMEDLENFRQLGSKTPGHPEIFTDGVEATTGPLGQGLANAVGYSISIMKIRSKAKVYVIFGDGCYQEGISHEAFSLASHLVLKNITFIYDSNNVTIDGSTELSMSDDPVLRFRSYDFEIYEVNGEDLFEIERVLKIEPKKPKLIILRTRIAEGCSRVGDFKTHGAPLGQAVVDELKNGFGDFELDDSVLKFYDEARLKNQRLFEEDTMQNDVIKETYDSVLSQNNERGLDRVRDYVKSTKKMATREHIPHILDEFGEVFRIIGGSGDLTPSTLTRNETDIDFTKNNRNGTYIRFGIREHAMFAIQNGVTAHGYYRAFGSTFLNFISYGFPAVRLAALSRIPNIYLMTHDSIGLGEDGPTHQPIEILPLLRATPNLYVFRPCDGLESRFAFWFAATRRSSPTVISFTRQKVPEIAETNLDRMKHGAYFISKPDNSQITILASGSEVSIALETAVLLGSRNIPTAVVSFLSFELFEEQSLDYKETVLHDGMRVSLEAASTFGWSRYAHYSIGIDEFGHSAKAEDLYDHFGLVPCKLVEQICGFYSNYITSGNKC
ncbi:Transketolase [Trachipleistophora hominis]|uniref:transketolase n=1 Tax=Trachipleistophora hominis TaxID=72359 RepID=L7K021_TRAHO|nr:Transketolase [Trachipleistophora hominis]